MSGFAGRMRWPIVLSVLALLPIGLVSGAGAAREPGTNDQSGAKVSGRHNSWMATGEGAVAALGDDLPAVAARNGLTAAVLRDVLRTDSTAWVDAHGFVSFNERRSHGRRFLDEGEAQFPLEGTFYLQSRPLSEKTIYLDFTGQTVSSTTWNLEEDLPSGFYQGYSLDADFTSFSDLELQQIQSIWQRVSEDFAGRDVNVTTRDLGFGAVDRADSSDNAYGTTVLISNDWGASEWVCASPNNCGGRSIIGSFDGHGPAGGPSSHAYRQPTWVFGHLNNNNTKRIAEAAAHEAGHTLGLLHDGRILPDTTVEDYYSGHNMWAPLMGDSRRAPLTQWSRGEYAGANNREDDFAIMASHGVPELPDQAPSGVAGAPALPAHPEYITSYDWDTYALGTCSGSVVVSAEGADTSPDLDIKLELFRGNTFLQSADPPSNFVSEDVASGLDATLEMNLAPDSYYVRVSGAARDPLNDGYSRYGSVGAYTIRAFGCGAQPGNFKVLPAANGRSAELSWTAPVAGPAANYVVSRTDPSNPETTVAVNVVGNHHTFTGLLPGGIYTFGVAGASLAGQGPSVIAAAMMPAAPSPPASVVLTPSLDGEEADLTWSAPDDNGSPITAYKVTRTNPTNPGTVITRIAPKTTPYYAWQQLTPGATYTFTVAAQNAVGFGLPFSKTVTQPVP